MTKASRRFGTTILVFALCVGATWAQQKDPRVNPPVAPEPSLSPRESSSKPRQEGASTPATETDSATPDTRPLSGAERFTLGEIGKRRSYVLASLDFFETADSNSGNTGNKTNFDTASTFSGHITLQRLWSRYQLTADYTGGGSIYNDRSSLNTTLHQFGLSQAITWRRWSLRLSDNLGYLPESAFGFGGFNSGLGSPLPNAVNLNPVSNVVNLNPTFAPSQTIFTSRAARLSNTAVGEVQYGLNPRSSITATGSYGILHFLGSDFINSNNAVFQTGYNHELTKRDTLALTYGFSRFWLGCTALLQQPCTARVIHDHTVQLGYGRRVTGRLALQLSAGPEIYRASDPVSGSGRRLTWTTSSSLHYRFPRTELELSYANLLGGGAGVLRGTRNHEVQLTVTRQLSRMWSGSLDLGFARNIGLRENTTQIVTAQSVQPTFNSWHTGVNVNRPLGRYTNIFFNYVLLRQTAHNNAPCIVGGICATTLLRHHFGLGFNWHLRPIRID